MATTYNGNKDANESPSAAPAPGVIPAASIPQDGVDAVASSTVAQSMKVNADYLAYLQASARFCPPRLAASGTGFTAPVYVSFGGTVAPSGNVKLDTGTNFKIVCTLGGAVGVAKFKTSIDGGTTLGSEQTTAASMTCATSGITLAFSGTLTLNGTAQFFSAFTPLLQFVDSSGNAKSMVDYLGFPRGLISGFTEDWTASGAVSNAFAAGGTFKWNASVPSPSTVGVFPAGGPGAGYNSARMGISTAGITAGNQASLNLLVAPFMFATYTSFVMEFEADISAAGANNTDVTIGFSTSTSGTPANSDKAIAIVKRAADTSWFGYTCDGSTGQFTALSAVSASTITKFVVELHGSASPFGAKARFFVNGALFEHTAHLPTTGVAMAPLIAAKANGGASSISMGVGVFHAVWNRYLSMPTF